MIPSLGFIQSTEMGKTVRNKTKKDKKGKFGRILGELHVGDININQSMIDNFFAVEYYGQSKEEIEKEHILNRQTLIAKGLFKPDKI